jgi:magnesium chelatase family protein
VIVAGRVRDARQGALDRQASNGELAGAALDRHCALDDASAQFLQKVTTRLGWSARSFHRILRVARIVADLEACAAITSAHLGEAIQYRRGLSSVT